MAALKLGAVVGACWHRLYECAGGWTSCFGCAVVWLFKSGVVIDASGMKYNVPHQLVERLC
jgi:hypothetical protein